MCDAALDLKAIEGWLRESDSRRLNELWAWADCVRRRHVGDEIHLRGLVEISNFCVRSCAYCGIRAPNMRLTRYRMSEDEILECARMAVKRRCGTIVLQSGEDYGMEARWVARVIRRIREETPLAVTLSLGERSVRDLAAWREAGADRYLLRFETSDGELYRLIHPPVRGERSDRIAQLREIRRLGYETGSGVMVGIPGQTFASLARDIELFSVLDLDMIGVGPYIPHPDTPLGAGQICPYCVPQEQVPRDDVTACKVVALARLVRPDANIPSTTALATVNPTHGRLLGLQRGANVVMPNLTPARYRALYEIYPGKAVVSETAGAMPEESENPFACIGRTVGVGPGGRRKGVACVATRLVQD